MAKSLYKIKLQHNQNIKILREEKKWSQQTLAKNASLSMNTIQKLEQEAYNDSTIQTVKKLADAFGVSIDDLIGRKVKEIKNV